MNVYFLIDRISAVTVTLDPAGFGSVSYTDIPAETPGDGTVPEYDEIIDQEEEPSNSLVPAQAQPDSNHYCSAPQPPENIHDCSIVSLLFIRSSPSNGQFKHGKSEMVFVYRTHLYIHLNYTANSVHYNCNFIRKAGRDA